MARDIWISSDWHLFHENILKFTDNDGNLIRPGFSNVDEMNECILERHNELVKPGDLHYNLGDVFMGDKEKFKKLFPKFHGRKRLIVGNHDDIIFLASGGFFQKVQESRSWKEYKMVFQHKPLHEFSMRKGPPEDNNVYTCVHGHIHGHDSPPGRYVNVCVEKTDYRPLHIDEVAELCK